MPEGLRYALPFAALLVIGCDQKEKDPVYDLKEVIGVKGTCIEDKARNGYAYAGNVVRLQDGKNRTISTYGSVIRVASGNQRTSDVEHQASYSPPNLISFYNIKVDTRQDRWVLRGILNSGKEARIYGATCELDVVKRTTERPNRKN